MSTNNAVNNQGLASVPEAEFGASTAKLLSPFTLKALTDNTIQTGIVRNLGMTISGGTLTMTAADGSALSVSNKAEIVLRNPLSAFLSKSYFFSAPVDITEAQMSGNIFNTRAAVAWAEQHPFFVYAVANGASGVDAVFMISAQSGRTLSPLAANIGTSVNPIADQEYAFLSFDNVTVANYASSPCVCVGSFRATKDSANAWTFTALDQTDGVGQFKENIWFNMPVGQFIAGSYFINVTPPVFSSQAMRYKIDQNQICYVAFDFSGDGGADGSGTNQMQIFLPYDAERVFGGSINHRGLSGQAFFAGTTRSNLVCDFPGTQRVAFFRLDATGLLLCSQFTNGDRYVRGSIRYIMREAL